MSDPLSEPLRIAVVDDDFDFRLLLRVQLDALPELSVVADAGDGEEAVDIARGEDPPDAFVMDLLMPKMNGFEAIDVIRKEYPEIGMVAYTAVAGAYARDQVSRLGAELVLKSGDPTDLVEALKRSVEKARSAS